MLCTQWQTGFVICPIYRHTISFSIFSTTVLWLPTDGINHQLTGKYSFCSIEIDPTNSHTHGTTTTDRPILPNGLYRFVLNLLRLICVNSVYSVHEFWNSVGCCVCLQTLSRKTKCRMFPLRPNLIFVVRRTQFKRNWIRRDFTFRIHKIPNTNSHGDTPQIRNNDTDVVRSTHMKNDVADND